MTNLHRTVQVIEGLEEIGKALKGTEEKSTLDIINDVLQCADGIVGIAKWWEDLDPGQKKEAVTLANRLWEEGEELPQKDVDRFIHLIMGEEYEPERDGKKFEARALHLIRGLKDK